VVSHVSINGCENLEPIASCAPG